MCCDSDISVLFSEPKIPQTKPLADNAPQRATISVLFSEPKIPQKRAGLPVQAFTNFSALQRAENSSKICVAFRVVAVRRISVLFSEPKIPQFSSFVVNPKAYIWFQCSSASRKFLN